MKEIEMLDLHLNEAQGVKQQLTKMKKNLLINHIYSKNVESNGQLMNLTFQLWKNLCKVKRGGVIILFKTLTTKYFKRFFRNLSMVTQQSRRAEKQTKAIRKLLNNLAIKQAHDAIVMWNNHCKEFLRIQLTNRLQHTQNQLTHTREILHSKKQAMANEIIEEKITKLLKKVLNGWRKRILAKQIKRHQEQEAVLAAQLRLKQKVMFLFKRKAKAGVFKKTVEASIVKKNKIFLQRIYFKRLLRVVFIRKKIEDTFYRIEKAFNIKNMVAAIYHIRWFGSNIVLDQQAKNTRFFCLVDSVFKKRERQAVLFAYLRLLETKSKTSAKEDHIRRVVSRCMLRNLRWSFQNWFKTAKVLKKIAQNKVTISNQLKQFSL